MKRKFFSVLLALVLVCSFSLVTAVPVAAQSSYGEYTLDDDGEASAYWSDAEANSGKHSAELDVAGFGSGIYATVILEPPPGITTLNDLNSASFYYKLTDGVFSPYLDIALDTDLVPDGMADEWLLGYPDSHSWIYDKTLDTGKDNWESESGATYPTYDSDPGWVQQTPINDMWIVAVSGTRLTLTQAKDHGTYPCGALGDAEIVGIKVFNGEWHMCDEAVTAYVDDVEINGVTYDLQPEISTGALFYQTGDTVTVTLIYGDENTNPAVSESVGVNAYIDTPYQEIVVALQETGVNTGVFVGTFKLVGDSPGPGELYVSHDTEIEVYYNNGDWFDDYIYVDDFAPAVEITAPADGDFVAGAVVNIAGTVVEDNLDTWSLEIDGTEVEATYGEGSVTYTWDTTEEAGDPLVPVWPDGAYTIEAVATDLGGLVGSDPISVTVDNTEPSITDAEAEPPTIYPATKTEVTFSANVTDAGSGIALVEISGTPIGTLAMLDEDADDIYTVAANITASEANYTLTITATDEVGNSSDPVEITLGVWEDIESPAIGIARITYPIGAVSARVGEYIYVCAVVTDETALALESPVTLSAATDVFGVGDGPPYTVTMTAEEGSDVFMTPMPLEEESLVVDSGVADGSYELTVTATDAKGNLTTETLTLEVASTFTAYNIFLNDGWNLVSLPLMEEDSSTEVVLDGLSIMNYDLLSFLEEPVEEMMPDILSVWGYDPVSGWQSYFPGEPSDLTQMTDGSGYWVNAVVVADEPPAILTIYGTELPVPPALPPAYDVEAGWNLIGFKEVHEMSAQDYLAGITDSVVRIYGFQDGAYYTVQLGDPMHPSLGYWLAVTDTGTIYP